MIQSLGGGLAGHTVEGKSPPQTSEIPTKGQSLPRLRSIYTVNSWLLEQENLWAPKNSLITILHGLVVFYHLYFFSLLLKRCSYARILQKTVY